jgi:hypothetical protein
LAAALYAGQAKAEKLQSMADFNDRERSEETKFKLDQELEFKAQARRAKLVGLWVAELMGLSGAAADDYAKSVVMADMEEAGSEDIFRKVRADLDLQSVQLSDHQIRAKMEECLAVAREQIKAGQ